MTRIRVRLALAVVGAAVAAFAVSPVANASTAGTIGAHNDGWATCNFYGSSITVYTPALFAVNARYGSSNDYQHVAYTVYFYDGTTGALIGNGGRFVSWLYPGFTASDSGSALFNDYQSKTYSFNGHGPVTMRIFEEWFDSPTTSAFSATHSVRTGWAWDLMGTCNV